MSIEALYAIEFTADKSHWQGGGVVVLETGRIFGGDSSLAYVGTFELVGDQITASVRVVRHNNTLRSIFGTNEQEFMIKLTGTVNKPTFDSITFEGKRPDVPHITMFARAKRIADLP